MKALRDFLDKLGPKVKDNKVLHTAYDAIDTLLYAPKSVTQPGGTHIKDGMDLKRTMFMVVIAMQLCYVVGSVNIGHHHYLSLGLYQEGFFNGFFQKILYGLGQLLPIFIVTNLVGLGIEILFAARKGHPVEEGFLVTGALIPLIMPPAIPLWIVAIATAFAVIIVKEAFGGTGMNIFNVALMARVFVFFAYPKDISGDVCWVAYEHNIVHHIVNSLGQLFGQVDLLSLGKAGSKQVVDGFSGATPLALAAKGGWSEVTNQYTVSDMIWGVIPGSIGETSKIACVLGAILLIKLRIASWRIMLSMVLGLAFAGVLMNALAYKLDMADTFIAVPWYYQYIMGSFLFAMAFMATDPVTAASTNTGKWVYGFLIGAIGLIIRVLNPAYPEGWMLAILFLNLFAPLIDYVVIQSNIKRRLRRAN